MKKQYIFLIIIAIILYIIYLILSFTYKEYKINSHIEYISSLNADIKKKIKESEKIIDYKSSKAYRNKILKEQQSFKNKAEKVVYLTTEKKYNKFTVEKEPEIEQIKTKTDTKLDNLSIFEKWIHFINKKNIYY